MLEEAKHGCLLFSYEGHGGEADQNQDNKITAENYTSMWQM